MAAASATKASPSIGASAEDGDNLPILLQQVRERINVLKMDTQRSSDYADRLEREALDIKNSARKSRMQADQSPPSHGSASVHRHAYAGRSQGSGRKSAHRHVNKPVHKETRASALRRAHIAKMRASKAGGSSVKARKRTTRDELEISAHEYNSVHVDRHGNVSLNSPRVGISRRGGGGSGGGGSGINASMSASSATNASLNVSAVSDNAGDASAFVHSSMYPRTIVERAKLARIIERVGVNRGIIQKEEKPSRKHSKESRPRSRIDEYYIAQRMEGVRNVGQQRKEDEVAASSSAPADQERRTPRKKRSAVKQAATAMERRQSQLFVSPERQAGLFKVYEAEVVAEVSRPKSVRGLGHGVVNGEVRFKV